MKRKASKNPKKNPRALLLPLVLMALALAGLAIWGVMQTLNRLEAACERQYVLTDAAEQVEIATGKAIPSGMIVDHFGLTNGANLAQIDFSARRRRLLLDMPNLRDVKITRRMPRNIRIEAVERIPEVRVIGGGRSVSRNFVADRDGVIFWYPLGKTMLMPIIRETRENQPASGKKLSGMAMAALRLIEESSAPEYAVLKIQEVDTFKPDYLFVTLGDSSRAKIAWEGMLKPTASSRISLTNQLTRLTRAIESNLAAGTKLWNATDWGTPGRVYADDPSRAE
jgi:hypothetical protein